jgi:general secretion pathway protein H
MISIVPHDTQEGGFTLAELLVVLAVLALIGVAAIGYDKKFKPTPTARDVSRSIARHVSQAALLAITTSKTQTVTVAPLRGVVSTTGAGAEIFVPPELSLSATAALELLSQDGSARIELYPDGTSSGGEIRVADADRFSYVVRVHWLTGSISRDVEK